MKQLDVLFVNPNSSRVYQDLSKSISAIEPPVWALLLAQSCRSKGFSVQILDCDALRLDDEEAARQIAEIDPKLTLFVVYGQNPQSGITNMTGAISLAQEIRNTYPTHAGISTNIAFVGTYMSALPLEALAHNCIDIVLTNEGVYALHELLKLSRIEMCCPPSLRNINGIGYKDCGLPKINLGAKIVPQDRMDIDLPGYAWDLLPYKEKPLDLYRAHVWHTGYNEEKRSPFAALYTSLGCQFSCNFCVINILNRTDMSEGINSSHSNVMRFWSPEFIIKEFDKLAHMGVETIRISDEMFFLNKKYYSPLIDLLIERDYKIDSWTYSRIDTVLPRYLEKFKQAGINWLALGIESANQTIRQEITKGKFKDTNIRDVVKTIQASDINVGANYIVGFPGENYEHMQQTLDLALELNAENSNIYAAAPLPGSPLYYEAKQNNWQLPDSFEGYGFLSYECLPSRTKYLSAADVLRFRDEAWTKIFTSTNYLNLVEKKFGLEQRKNVERITSIKLRRKILEDQYYTLANCVVH